MITVPSREIPESLALLDQVTDLIRATDPDSWWEGPTFRSPCGTKHCVLAHIESVMGVAVMDRFQNEWSTSYVIGGAVNDRPSERYPQPHPKDRVLAYLAELRTGAQLDTACSMERDYLANCGQP